MGWVDYYRLYVETNGNLRRASKQSLALAAKRNPNDPVTARKLARKKYVEDYLCRCEGGIKKCPACNDEDNRG